MFLLNICVLLARSLQPHPRLSLSDIGIPYLLQVTIKMIPRIDYNQMRGAMKSVAVSILQNYMRLSSVHLDCMLVEAHLTGFIRSGKVRKESMFLRVVRKSQEKS